MSRPTQHVPFHPADAPEREEPGCEHPGCDRAGDYPAPRSRRNLRDYRWFCLEHVREYNSAWDFYAGMDADAIERERRADVTWRRPTWPLGAQSGNCRGEWPFSDGFGLFDEGPNGRGSDHDAPVPPALGVKEREALDLLDLSPPITHDAVRQRYKELVKRLHPDANGGDKNAEERLKLVNHAYSTLMNSLSVR